MKLAVIDIGSNAARMQISNVLQGKNEVKFKKVEYVRYALRLGQDVFREQFIPPHKEEKLMQLMQAYQLLMRLHEVDDWMICATSAMRNARNGPEIAQRVNRELGLEIEIIDGYREAEIINRVIANTLDDKIYLHVDVGGGSTELNLYGMRKKIDSASFQMGSLREATESEENHVWQEMRRWVEKAAKPYEDRLTAIGTGGNISKLYDLAGLYTEEAPADKRLSLKQIRDLQEMLSSMTLQERMAELMLNEDRADVIVPASYIYTAVMKYAKTKRILVPDIGLKDGMMAMLYQRNRHRLESWPQF